MILFRYVFDSQPLAFNRIGTTLLGLFPLVSMFVVTSVTMLRERTGGTLERLMTMPLQKLDLLLGYGLAFGAMAIVQVSVVCVIAFGPLGLRVPSPEWQVAIFGVLNSLIGMSLGLFVSAFATTEFQAVQFMPAFVLPQFLLCGIITPRDQMANWLHAISDVLPMTYAYDGLDQLRNPQGWTGTVTRDVVIVVGVTLLGLCLGALTLRRRTP